MKLPVTSEIIKPSPLTLWRRFADVLFDHALGLGEELPLTGVRGTASKIFVAEDGPSIDVSATVTAYATQSPPAWIVPDHATATAAAIAAIGYVCRSRKAMRLNAASSVAIVGESPVMLLPGRAGRAAFTAWCERRSALELPEHLDDPQYDSIVALHNGRAIGGVGLQTRGQTGLICDLYVESAERRRGLGSRLIARAIEIAARGQLHDVFAGIADDDTDAARLLAGVGFATICDYGEWCRPR